MTATATPDDLLVQQPSRSTKFVSHRSELRLVKVPRRLVRNQDGDVVDEKSGQTVRFEPYDVVTGDGQKYRAGRFDCPVEGTIRLEDDREVDAADVHAWLERHRLNGNRAEGFWPVEQPVPVPSQEELDRLVQAAVSLDEDRLAAIVEQERAGWARPEILRTAEGALERLRALKALPPEELDKELNGGK